jgi:hypothetical protein
MGEREYIDHCIETLNFIYQADEDRFVRSRFLYYVKEIRKIRQPDTISIIISYSEDESETMAWVGSLSVVANVAIGALRDSLYGFPIDDSAYPFTPEQRQVAREWLKNTYHPRLIKSHSVLIDGKLYDNIADWQKGLIKIVDGKVVILDEPEGTIPEKVPESGKEDPATGMGHATGGDAINVAESPLLQAKDTEYYDILKKYDDINYRELLDFAPQESNIYRQESIESKIMEISRKTTSDFIKTDIAQFFLGRYLRLDGPLKWHEYLGEIAAYLTNDDRNKIVDALVNARDRFGFKDRLICLIGELNIHEAIPALKKMLEGHSPTYRPHNLIHDRHWCIRLALAQMGDREYIDHCIEAINISYPTSDDRIGNYSYLNDVSSMRQPEAMNIIMNFSQNESLASTKKKSVSIWAKLAVGIIVQTQLLYDFPLNKNNMYGRQMNDDEKYSICREWLKNTYHPRLIKSHSVLIDGKLYDNIADWQKGLIKIVDGKVVILDEPEGAAPTASPETAHPVPAGDQGQ